ncbi:MAG: hypothetical protein BGO89_07970 [Candidatus Kapaibacterium thiocyanatum]|uniref:Uncharacterized protein n=1 Tax=Candidatus Kapaibacterium thiocyanatum TaxID=1895771 RepID=A0A1M3L3J5_9BACT|nr:MAG: hypothetical protein BGO89_07970 ['Candidatus Kapabacteria' thiocyanatum]
MRPAWDVEEQGTLFFLEMYVKEGRNELREAQGKVSLIPELILVHGAHMNHSTGMEPPTSLFLYVLCYTYLL